MDDLISRRAAIDALAKFVPYAICDESTESYTNGLTDAYYLILQLPSVQPEQKWIPCSERMPEYAEDVIFCDKYSFIAIGNYEDGRWHTDCGDIPDDVVAWMPLPDAYEEVNNK